LIDSPEDEIEINKKFYPKVILYNGPSVNDVVPRVEKPTAKSSAWHAATWSHYTHCTKQSDCNWCIGFTRFISGNRYTTMNVSSLQEKVGTSESMKK